MKLKEGFIMRDVAGHTVVLPTGDDLNMNMMIRAEKPITKLL